MQLSYQLTVQLQCWHYYLQELQKGMGFICAAQHQLPKLALQSPQILLCNTL